VIRSNLPHAHDTPQILPHVCLSANHCGSRLPQLPQHSLLNAPGARCVAANHCICTSSVCTFLSIKETTEALRQKRGKNCGTTNPPCLTNLEFSEAAEANAEANDAATGEFS
jgi:hypothetical protein